MASKARTGPRQFRRIVRTFFAYRRWLLVLWIAGAIAAVATSARQPTTYVGRLELASAADGSPTRAVLPDIVRLRQLAFNPENLNRLTSSENNAIREGSTDPLAAKIAKTASLEPISTSPSGCSVWRLSVEIPARSHGEAQRRLEAFAKKIDLEFRENLVAVRRAGHSPLRLAGEHVHPAVYQARTSGREDAAPKPADSTQSQAADSSGDPLAELAKEFGVSIDELPAIADSIRAEFGRRAKEIEILEQKIDELVRHVHRIEAKEEPTEDAAQMEQDNSAFRSLCERRDTLNDLRSKLAMSLKPAHPDYQAVEGMIQEVEARLKSERSRLVELCRSKIRKLETRTRQLHTDVTRDRSRLDALADLSARTDSAAAAPSSIPSLPEKESDAPRPMPSLPSGPSSTQPAEEIDRPIGRVVLPTPTVDVNPIRPRTSRNVGFALLGAFLAYAAFVVVRAGSDQRIHGTEDLEGFDVDVPIFGSIPSQRTGCLVRFARGG